MENLEDRNNDQPMVSTGDLPCLFDKLSFLLHLADTSLVLSQRNAEWCGHGPVLEQDIAITNISLDLLGQARNFYQYAALLINQDIDTLTATEYISLLNEATETCTEDTLAYLRTERVFKNLLITELPKGDWAQTILRQFFFSVYAYLLYEQLQDSKDEQLDAIAAKSIKELAYHVKWSSEWVIRLGDGTEESNHRMKKAIDSLWMYTGEFFIQADYEKALVSEGIMMLIKDAWRSRINAVFEEATLTVPGKVYMHTGGKTGYHTEHLGLLLPELQYLQRTYPGAEW